MAQISLLNCHGGGSVVAHRGASAYLPEHTLPAYAMAHAQGADYIEPDVVLTGDGVLLCLHDLYLETTTDVAERFPERERPDRHYYAADFTLLEIKSLRAFGRVSESERAALQGYQVATLEELILLVQRLNRATSRRVGLLIETKTPEFHVREGKPLETPLAELLGRYGYAGRDSDTIIQSFDKAHLKRLRDENGWDLPLMWLTNLLPAPDDVDEMATWADGLNPGRFAFGFGGLSERASEVLGRARSLGLKTFVWTFNADTDAMRTFLYEYGIDGVITNNPDFGVRAATKTA